MNRDEIDFDKLFDEDMPFKPLSEGLGFHHEKKEETKLSTIKARQVDVEKSLNLKIHSQKPTTPIVKKYNINNDQPVERPNMGDLAAFYEPKVEAKIQVEIEEGLSFESQTEASLINRFLAYLLDLSILTTVLAITFLSILISSGISLIVVRENLSIEFISTTILPIGMLFYVFYFSFFDKTNFSSPGKKMLNLQVVSYEGESPSMTQTFSRSIVTLFSVLSAGLLSLLDFHGKLTETKVIKK